jgi:putative spermidine/putrescine transport system permease protein
MLPYMIIILYSTMIGIDRNLLDASRSFGASGWQTFRRVFLPLSMPGVYAGALLVFIVSLGFYLTPALLGGGGDLTMALYINQEVHLLKFGVAGAMSMVLLVITVSLFVVFDRLFGTAKLVQGALKR